MVAKKKNFFEKYKIWIMVISIIIILAVSILMYQGYKKAQNLKNGYNSTLESLRQYIENDEFVGVPENLVEVAESIASTADKKNRTLEAEITAAKKYQVSILPFFGRIFY